MSSNERDFHQTQRLLDCMISRVNQGLGSFCDTDVDLMFVKQCLKYLTILFV